MGQRNLPYGLQSDAGKVVLRSFGKVVLRSFERYFYKPPIRPSEQCYQEQ